MPGLYAKVARPSAKQLARIRKLPLSEAKFKKDAGILPGVRLWGERQYSPLERQWTRPALTVIALEARRFRGSSNQIIEAARARLSLRTVPRHGRPRGRPAHRQEAHHPAALWGEGHREDHWRHAWWTTDPEGPAFEAARAALKAGFGKEAAIVGASGTIGFVQPFADLLERAPCTSWAWPIPTPRPTPRTRACTWATG